ncbi:MAG: hypothetical protein ACE5HZ_02605, partial [Fidelibacterota bacterium]
MVRLALSMLFTGFFLPLSSQNADTPITAKRERLLILPASWQATGELQSVANEAVGIVSDVATSLGRFDVIDRTDLEEILREQALQLTGLIDDSTVVEVGHIASAHEAVIVDVLNFHQQGVPPEEDEKNEEEEDEGSLFGRVVLALVKGMVDREHPPSEQREQDPYPHNIQTTLSVRVKQVEVETGRTLNSFTSTSVHTGGTRGYSRSRVMEEFRQRALTEIKGFYLLTSQVISVTGGEVLLFLGSTVGVRPGTLFEIVQPDRVTSFRGRDIVVPGRRVGVVEVRESSTEANRSVILRNWLPVEAGHKALEYTRMPLAFELRYFPAADSPFAGLQGGVILRPFHFNSLGGEVRLGTVTDTYGDSDFVIGMGASGTRRLLRFPRLSLAGSVKLHFDFALRPDDGHQTVVTALFSATPQLGMEFLLSEARDLTVALGYRLSTKSSHWTYSEQTDEGKPRQVDAYWKGQPPEV